MSRGKSVNVSATRVILGIGANLVPDGYETPQQGCAAALEQLVQHDITIL